MENLYPLFERNRILKKELMWALRDYAFADIQLEYQGFPNGILKGCGVKVRGQELVVSKGLAKYGGFVYLVTEEMSLPYGPKEKLQVLKMKLEEDKGSEDFTAYRVNLFLDDNPVKQEGELELCRFKLQHGSRLREDYKNFEDMATEYDTVNLLEADFASVSGKSFSPEVTGYFAREALKAEYCQAEDISFAYLCLSQPGAVSREVVWDYVGRKLSDGTGGLYEDSLGDGEAEVRGNTEIFQGMVSALREMQTGSGRRTGRDGGRRRILVE